MNEKFAYFLVPVFDRHRHVFYSLGRFCRIHQTASSGVQTPVRKFTVLFMNCQISELGISQHMQLLKSSDLIFKSENIFCINAQISP